MVPPVKISDTGMHILPSKLELNTEFQFKHLDTHVVGFNVYVVLINI